MSRNTGNAIFSANFEPRMGAPLDARLVVESRSSLTNPNVWDGGDGNAYVYKGMVVSVINDSTELNNGLYVLKNLDYENYTSWEKVGGGGGDGGSDIIQITYADLHYEIYKMLEGEDDGLIPFQRYLIVDYRTVHFILNGSSASSDVNYGELEPLLITTDSYGIPTNIAQSQIYPTDIIHYDWNPENWMGDISFFKDMDFVDEFSGVIYYREDTINQNKVGYDFRNVKFRRWEIIFSDEIDPEEFEISKYDGGYYYSHQTYMPPNGIYTVGSNFRDVYTFQPCDDMYGYDSNVNRNTISGFLKSDGFYQMHRTILSNNVFFFDGSSQIVSQNSFTGMSLLNTFSGTISNNYFSGGILYNTFITKSIIVNTNGGLFMMNNIMGEFDHNDTKYFETNNIVGNFEWNVFGVKFANNVIMKRDLVDAEEDEYEIKSLRFADNNIIGEYTQNNVYGNFVRNVVQGDFQQNTIVDNGLDGYQDGCNLNEFSRVFENNIIGSSCQKNRFGVGFTYNVLLDNFMNNTTDNEIMGGYGNPENRTLTTSELYNSRIPTTIFKLPNLNDDIEDDIKIRYYNDNMDLIIKSAKE